METKKNPSFYAFFLLCVSVFLFFSCRDSSDSSNNKSTPPVLEQSINIGRIVSHLENLERIANENLGNREAGSNGYDESVNYVRQVLAGTDYIVKEQTFPCRYFRETATPVLKMQIPNQKTYEWWKDFRTLTYSGSGDVTAEIVFLDPMIPPGVEPNTSDDGCEIEDFDNIDLAGKIAVIQRGTCRFQDKAENAEKNGARAVLIFNEGQEGRTEAWSTRLARAEKVNIPVVAISHKIGVELFNLVNSGQPVNIRVKVTARDEWTSTANLIAEIPGGNARQTIIVSAHLDSVSAGPGINDNGSGSAAILELATQIYEQDYQPVNKIIFAWWAAEEQGLLGSLHYLEDLAQNNPSGLQNIGICLNLDQIASPNFVRVVMDSDQSNISSGLEVVPPGSTAVEAAFVNYFQAHGLPNVFTSLRGSDHFNFVNYGIPAGALTSGGSGLKTQYEQNLFGGIVGQPHFPCYHESCDITANISQQILLENTQAIAHVTEYFGSKPGGFFNGLRASVARADYMSGILKLADEPNLLHKTRRLPVIR